MGLKYKADIDSVSLMKKLTAVLAVFSLVMFSLGWGPFLRSASAAPGDVIINELMYHPSSDNSNDEYVELYNTTGSPIDLDGWCFTDGIVLCFTAGQTIAANGYLVVSPNNTQTNTTYGVTPPYGEYTGALKNGGETVELSDGGATVIDTVTYDDNTPWPISPDGTGPSLELKDTSSDNTLPASWGASLGGATPSVVNSLAGLAIPDISSVTDPNDVAAAAAVPITANITGSGITDVELKYKLNFDADVTLTMYDDGATGGDVTAGDDVYTATIPGQAIKNLVRFKIEVTNADGTWTSPTNDDTMNYHGYYVADPGVSSNAEILDWFIDDSDYTDLTNPVDPLLNTYYDAVVVYDNEVYDNTQVRLKGEQSRNYDKKSYKIELPQGYEIDVDGGSNRTLNEFHLDAAHYTGTIASNLASFWTIEQAGMDIPDIFPVRLQKSGEFEGLYNYQEKYREDWREEYGYDDGQFFEDYNEIESGADDFTDIDAFYDAMLLDRNDPARREATLDIVNVPSVSNFAAVQAILSSWDHSSYQNTYYYRPNDTERWEVLFWDLSSAWSSDPRGFHFPSPYDHWQPSSPDELADQFYLYGIYDEVDLREIILRRVRTLYDKLYANNSIEDYLLAQEAIYSADMALDLTKWPADGVWVASRQTYANTYKGSFAGIKQQLGSLYRLPWGIPPSQTDAERQSVSFDEVVSSANDADEYIRLTNSASTAVDLTDWTIEGAIDYTFPAGAVIPAGGEIYILRDDLEYRATHDPVLTTAKNMDDLGGSGSLTLKTDGGGTIDTHAY